MLYYVVCMLDPFVAVPNGKPTTQTNRHKKHISKFPKKSDLLPQSH